VTPFITVVAYDPEWPLRFERERTLLASVLAGTGALIEHVGSTAVPGLGAKPIIDIMAKSPFIEGILDRALDEPALGHHANRS
jgi:GrpB-like predicted nucleotidyltransferase (UPF0157 family)